MYEIIAYSDVLKTDLVLFTWTRSPEDGIARAHSDAEKFDRADELSNFRAILWDNCH